MHMQRQNFQQLFEMYRVKQDKFSLDIRSKSLELNSYELGFNLELSK